MSDAPDDLEQWTTPDLIRELRRLRAILREHAQQPGGDDEGGFVLDARSAIHLEHLEVILADPKDSGRPLVMLVLAGRASDSDDQVEHAYLYGPDAAAALVNQHLRIADHDKRFANYSRKLFAAKRGPFFR